MSQSNERDEIRQVVREGYGEIAKTGKGCCGCSEPDKLCLGLGYSDEDLAALPDGANMGLSCGNPTALANLKAGQVVLDLGSGAGIDVFIAAKEVGASGFAIGVDMTPEMVAKARGYITAFEKKTGLGNVEFRLGEIEHLPIADASVDVVISNCVINLAPDKRQVWREIGRVLKPGGRVCVSDLVLKKALPEPLRKMATALVGCIGGAVTIDETVQMAETAGLVDIDYTTKDFVLEIMEDGNNKLFQSVKKVLQPGEKLSDYIMSVNFTASKSE
jgi:2-polyprenyl-3-methyl-5-hydroxy-6-metoxy-1,4-benzoquinol methylase